MQFDVFLNELFWWRLLLREEQSDRPEPPLCSVEAFSITLGALVAAQPSPTLVHG